MNLFSNLRILAVVLLFIMTPIFGAFAEPKCEDTLAPVERLKAVVYASVYNTLRQNPALNWITLSKPDGTPYEFHRYNFSMPKLLAAAGLSADDVANVRQPRGANFVEFNTQAKEWAECPEAVQNYVRSLVDREFREYEQLKEPPATVSELKDFLVRMHNVLHHLNPIAADSYHLLDELVRVSEINSLQHDLTVMFPDLDQNLFKTLGERIEKDLSQKYRRPVAKQVVELQMWSQNVSDKNSSWFEIAGIKLPIAPYDQLPAAARKLIDLENLRIWANWTGDETVHDPRKMYRVYHAPSTTNQSNISYHHALIADNETKFFIDNGPWVQKLAHPPSDSTKPVTVKIPGYLLQSVDRVVTPKFPFKISVHTIE